MSGFLAGILAAVLFVVVIILMIMIGLGAIALRIVILIIPVIMFAAILALIGTIIYFMCKYWKITLGILVSLWIAGLIASAILESKVDVQVPINYGYHHDGFLK